MAELTIRAAGPGDVAVIGAIAAAAGQEDDWSGRNPAYVRHLLRHGRVLVAVVGEPGPGAQVAGFGATQLIGSGVAAVTMQRVRVHAAERHPAGRSAPRRP